MKYPAYPSYKASGVEGLGEVPAHWEVKRSDGVISTERTQIAADSFKDKEVFHYSIPVVQELGTGQIESGEDIASAKQVICKKTLLVSKLNPRKATICVAEPQEALTLCSTEFVPLTAERCELDYLKYLTLSELFRQRLDSMVQSVTRSHQRANPEDIWKFWFVWPPRCEQRTIADFLDHQTAKLDTLIAKKRALIERLKAKRTALISRTVTRGLPPEAARAAGFNPHPKMKDSGIEWLGEIPEHWERKPAKAVCERIVDCKNRTPEYDDEENFLVVRTTDVKGGNLFHEQCLRTDEANYLAWTLRGAPQRDDVLFTREAPAGEAAIYDGKMPICLGQRMMYFRTSKRTLAPRFLLYSIYGALVQGYILATSGGSTVTHLRLGQVYNLPLLIPPLAEQHAIAAYLDRETAKLDALVAKVEQAIKRLQDYRTALITAAVTGKIDVSGTETSSSSSFPRAAWERDRARRAP